MIGTDSHVFLVPSGTSEVPTPMPCRFEGGIDGSLSPDVSIGGKRAAVAGSTAAIEHTPPPGTRFQKPPGKQGTIRGGSKTVFINGEPAARAGDRALGCDDSVGPRDGIVTATGTVWIG
jgi:uncharacterized Zn-binding protein involved in type VI secretion